MKQQSVNNTRLSAGNHDEHAQLVEDLAAIVVCLFRRRQGQARLPQAEPAGVAHSPSNVRLNDHAAQEPCPGKQM